MSSLLTVALTVCVTPGDCQGGGYVNRPTLYLEGLGSEMERGVGLSSITSGQ